MNTDYGHWEIFEDFNPLDYYGFIYLIENVINGRKYIGKKSFNQGWRTYYSSSCNKDYWDDIELYGIDNFNFLIIELVKDIKLLGDREVELLIRNDILNLVLPSGIRTYYNKSIANSKWTTSGDIAWNSGKRPFKSMTDDKIIWSKECPSGYELYAFHTGKRTWKNFETDEVVYAVDCPKGFILQANQAKPISVEGKIYNSMKAVARTLNVTPSTVRRRCESDIEYLDWFYSDTNNLGTTVDRIIPKISGKQYFINKLTNEKVLTSTCPGGFEKYVKDIKPNHTEDGLKRIAAGDRTKSKSPIIADGITFDSIRSACKQFGMTKGMVVHRCKMDKYENWYYIKKEVLV